MTTLPRPTEVVIIGGGQAGLSAAYYLRERGLRDFMILDRGPLPGGAWQHRRRALRLDLTHRVNDLPGLNTLGLSFRTAPGDRPAREIVSEYYGRYERDYDLPVRRPAEVTTVAPGPGERLLVHTRNAVTGQATESYLARAVVNASGTWERPYRPAVPGAETFAGRQYSTPQIGELEGFAGRRVIVVGGGTSAQEFILGLEPLASRVSWATRSPVHFIPAADLSAELGRAAVADQDRAARAGLVLPSIVSGTGVPLTPERAAARERGILVERPMFREITPTGVIWADGEAQEADDIIWATGFRAEIEHLAGTGILEPGGGIRVENGVAARDPRIFLAGYGPQASTIGAAMSGRATARSVLALLERPAKT